jgi:hypothetical protein
MSGIHNYNRDAFNDLESNIRIMCKSIDPIGKHKIFNPAKIEGANYKSYKQLMRDCIWGMVHCSHFIQLPNWEHSHGALIEYSIAITLEMPIISSSDIPKWLLKNLNLTSGLKR